ncbi:MAG: hypothetical protein ACOY40_14860 [Bacillota bacterium]
MAEKRSYDLSREMIDILAAEFDPRKAVESFAVALKDASTGGREQVAAGVFGDYGRRWAGRTIELGEKYVERTYEILKEAAKKTGRLAFPHIPQRFVEIGYLATQPVEFLNIVINNHYDLVYRVDRCATYDAVKEICGEEVAAEMPCRHACTAFSGHICRALKMNVDFKVEALYNSSGYCQFRATNRDT